MDETKKILVARIVCAVSVLAVLVAAVALYVPLAGGEEQSAAVLKVGSSGAQVRTLQTKLNNWGYDAGTVDGIFGSNTLAAVKRFQQRNGLAVDGIVGAKTAAALGMSLSSGSGGNSSYSSSDVYLLAKCIYAEARGEPYIGQVAIGAVVLNRVKSSAVRVHRGRGRTDKFGAERHRLQGGARRDERLGSDQRLPVLLQSGDRDERVDMVASGHAFDRQPQLCQVR